jgi:hypothetical protein
MAKLDQLEIIGPDGKIVFHELSPDKGITNIGVDPDNDIVIDSPRLGAFQAVLDHQHKPFRIMVLNDKGNARIAGQHLAANVFQELNDWQAVDLDGFTLTLLENVDRPESSAAVPSQAKTILSGPQDAAVVVPQAPALPAALPVSLSDLHDELIVAELSAAEWTVDVEQPASGDLTIVNGGRIVASFDVSVEGVDPSWITLDPLHLNLNEGARAVVHFSIVPPRHFTSRAGPHHLALVISSPNYPGHVTRLNATLILHPFFEFTIGNLTPNQQSVSWGKRSGRASYPITNFGNSPAGFNVTALDPENGCQFGFPLDEQVNLVKQAAVKVEPGQVLNVPVAITPLKRSLIRLQSKQYQYTVSTQSLDDPGALRSVAGSLTSRPLMGMLHIAILVLALLVGIYFLFKPQVNSFAAQRAIIRLGEQAVLTWDASPFTSELSISGITEPINASQRQVVTTPLNTATTYTLTGASWLSKLLPFIGNVQKGPISVLAIPAYPKIDTFKIIVPDQLFEGDQVLIKWSTSNAEQVTLTVEGVPTILAKDQFNGELKVVINKDTLIVLEATNKSGAVTRSDFIHPLKADLTKLVFTVDPKQVVKGQPVTVTWDVEGNGIDSINISAFKESLPFVHTLTFFPEASMELVLTVAMRGGKPATLNGVLVEPQLLTVGVIPQAATPKIVIFDVAPDKMTIPGTVQINWSVTGQTSDIVLSKSNTTGATCKDYKNIANKTATVLVGDACINHLTAQGFMTVPVNETTALMLTAFNGDASNPKLFSDTQSKAITVNLKKDVKVTITNVSPSTPQQVGQTFFIQIDIKPLKDGVAVDPKVVGYPEITNTIFVTDGFNHCTITLPDNFCSLKAEKIMGTSLKATYSGDDNYSANASDPVPPLNLVGSPAAIASITYTYSSSKAITIVDTTTSPDPIVVGQNIAISFILKPTSAQPDSAPITGGVTISADGVTVCTVTQLLADASGPLNAAGSCPPFVFNVASLKTLNFQLASDSYNLTQPPMNMIQLRVSKAPTQTVITTAFPTALTVGIPFQMDVSVKAISSGTGTPAGTVEVYDSQDATTILCTINLSGGSSCPSSTFARKASIGGVNRVFVAHYQGTANYEESWSPTVLSDPLTAQPLVNPADSDTILSISQTAGVPSEYGRLAVFSFTIQPKNQGLLKPAGSVSVYMQTGPGPTWLLQCGPVTLSQGSGACSSTLANFNNPNDVIYYAEYTPDVNFKASSSVNVPYSVQKAPTTININSVTPSDPTAFDTPSVNVMFTVSAAGGIRPGGDNVTIFTTNTGTNSVQTYVCSVPNYVFDLNSGKGTCEISHYLTEGISTITAQYVPGSTSSGFLPSPVSSANPPWTHSILKATKINLTVDNRTPTIGVDITATVSVQTLANTSVNRGSVTISATPSNGSLGCTIDLSKQSSCKLNFTSGGQLSYLNASYQDLDPSIATTIYAANPINHFNTGPADFITIQKAVTEIPPITFSKTNPANNEPFLVSFSVLNIQSAVTPKGTAAVSFTPGLACPVSPNPTPNQTANLVNGKGQVQLQISPSGDYCIMVVYSGGTDFVDSLNYRIIHIGP